MRSLIKILATTAVGVAVGAGLYNKYMPKISFSKYTEKCLYLAYLDDGICRNELRCKEIDGEDVVFEPKQESLNYRYSLFVHIYKNDSKQELDNEIKRLETRLEHTAKTVAEKEKMAQDIQTTL